MRYYIKSLLLLMVVAAVSPVWSQIVIRGYPFLAYSSETKLMGGAFAFAKYPLPSRLPDAPERSISLLTNTIYSQNKQFLVILIPEYKAAGFGMNTDLFIHYWPDTFYGIGNATSAELSEAYTSQRFAAETTISQRSKPGLGLALKASQGYHKLSKTVEDGLVESASLTGAEPSYYSGIGYSLSYDNTDGSFYPERGMKLEYRQLFFDRSIGSDFDYTETRYDARAYLPLSTKAVLAFQSDLGVSTNELPFYNYWELGSRLRAYDSKRFIDKVRIAQRLEQRLFPFTGSFSKLFGFVVFAESGQVAPTVQDIRFQDWHWSTGFGLRFSLLPQEKLNLRMDIGFGEDSVNLIINAREVF